MLSTDATQCPLCGNANDCQLCGVGPQRGPCGCSNAAIPRDLLARVPAELQDRACICRDCIAAFWREHQKNRPEIVWAGEFYFDETGLMVFTAEFHLRRGYCCGSGCRH